MTTSLTSEKPEVVLLRHRERVEEILRVSVSYGFADWAAAGAPSTMQALAQKAVLRPELLTMTTGERLRAALLELGPTFVKLGQILSTRPDVVGPDVAQVLQSLQQHTPADSPDDVVATVTAELGAPPDQKYATFDTTPLASASIGQVHAATTPDGRSVVVKVRHAGIEQVVTDDLAILNALAALVEQKSPELAAYRPAAAMAQLGHSLLEELDFSRELLNLQRFVKNFAGDTSVTFPEPVPELSGRSVLTEGRLDGPTLADRIGDLGSAGPPLVQKAAELYLQMVFRDRFFHADPHPGNIVLVGGDRIGLIDFGSCGTLSQELMYVLVDVVLAAYDRDVDDLTDAILRLTNAPRSLDVSALRDDLARWIDTYLPEGVEPGTVDMSGAITASMTIIQTHRLMLPSDVALLVRVLLELQGMLQETGVRIRLTDLLAPHVSSLLATKYSPRRLAHSVRRTTRDWERLIETAPRDIAAILEGVRHNEIEVPMRFRNLDGPVNRIVGGVVAAALVSGASSLWARKAAPTFRGISLPGLASTAAAAVVTVQVLRSVKRSGGYVSRER